MALFLTDKETEKQIDGNEQIKDIPKVKFPDGYTLIVLPDLNKVIYIFKDSSGYETAKFKYDEPLFISQQSNVGKEIKRHLNPDNRLSETAVLEDFEYIKMTLNENCQILKLQAENQEEEDLMQKEVELKDNMEIAKGILKNKQFPLMFISSLFSWETAGERSNITLAFVTYCSQIILQNPISVIGLGEGSSGKSHIEDVSLIGIPDEFHIKHKTISEAAFFETATEDPYYYDGKIVNFGDLGGRSSQDFVLEIKDLIKELQSDGYLSKIKMVADSSGGYIRKKLELFGHPCSTYTSVPNHEFDDQELSRSIFITPRTDNRKVFNERKKMLELRGRTYKKYKYYSCKMELIKYIVYVIRERMENIRVINPYTETIIEFLGNTEYFKRDFNKYNGILKTITAFNGYNRSTFEIDDETILYTSLDDIQIFMSLLEPYHESISVNVSPKAADVLADIRKNLAEWILNEKIEGKNSDEIEGLTTNDYYELSNIPLSKRSVQRYFGELNNAGFLKVIDKKGRQNVYDLTLKVSSYKKKALLHLTDKQVEMIRREIGDVALAFIQEDECHEGISIMLHDKDIEKPEWEDVDDEKYRGI